MNTAKSLGGVASFVVAAVVALAPAAVAAGTNGGSPVAESQNAAAQAASEDADPAVPPDTVVPRDRPQEPTTTTTTTTTVPPRTTRPPPTTDPPGTNADESEPAPPSTSGRLSDDILIGIAVQFRSFAPPAWTASEESVIWANLEATDLSGDLAGLRALREGLEPVVDVSGTFTRPGPSLRGSFIPTAILGALAAWATISGFERREKRKKKAPGHMVR